MQQPASSAGSSSATLRAALLDYCHSPGKYQVSLRQPQAVFSAVREVLHIAVGRDGEGAPGKEPDTSLRDAARFFVRTALLFPGADHYALFGVDRTVDNADLKDRYRLMMRLLHPDFSGPGAGSWPADSAVRVNRAYDTLSSAVQRRLYDESLAPAHANSPAVTPATRRPRPPVPAPDEGTRQSRVKILAGVCALAGVGLVALILSATGSPDSAQLVQRDRVKPEPASAALQEPAPQPVASPVRLQEALAQLRPALAPPPRAVEPPIGRSPPAVAVKERGAPLARAPVSASPRRLEVAEQRPERVQSVREAVASSPPPAEQRPDILVAAAPAVAPPPSPPQATSAVAPAPPAQAPTPFRPVQKPGPTLIEAQPLLSQLLQVMESGRGERILNLLDAEARNKPSAQALSRQYDSIVDGARPVRVSHVELKAEPGDGRLLVVGYFRVLAGEQTIGSLGKKMVLRAEFASREGNVVLTGLSGGPVN